MYEFDYLWKGGPEFAQSENFRFGTDSVLLGNFPSVSGVKKGIDLGCASGVITMILLARSASLHMTGLEIDPEAAALARENIARNSFQDRCTIVGGDIRRCRELLPSGGFDLVVSNPPYFAVKAGQVSPDARRATARGEVECTLEELCAAAAYLCRWGGRVAFVYRQERLSELLCTMTKHGIEPKRLRLVSHFWDSVPSLVLVEGRRGGSAGMKVEPQLVIKNHDGTDTAEIRRIYHMDQEQEESLNQNADNTLPMT